MTNSPTPSAMTDQQIIERLAEFMEFKTRTEFMGELYYWTHPEVGCLWMKKEDWNPLKDWNHWRQVEEKLMDDKELFWRFMISFCPHQPADGEHHYIYSDLPTRCKALISVLPTP